MNRSTEHGFTLIELLVIIGTLGILSYLSLSTIQIAKYNASNKAAVTSSAHARIALEAAMTEVDAIFPSVSLTQTVPGAIADPDGATLLPNFMVSKNTSFSYYHDAACVDSSCTLDRITVRHCFGSKYIEYTRFGDGLEILLDEIPGVGC